MNSYAVRITIYAQCNSNSLGLFFTLVVTLNYLQPLHYLSSKWVSKCVRNTTQLQQQQQQQLQQQQQRVFPSDCVSPRRTSLRLFLKRKSFYNTKITKKKFCILWKILNCKSVKSISNLCYFNLVLLISFFYQKCN